MKMMVKLTVLFATVLLLNGVAFACYTNCYCYDVTAINLDDPEQTEDIFTRICHDCQSGSIIAEGFGLFGNMSIFFDSMNEQALGYGQDEAEGCVGYIKYHGDEEYILQGIGYCDGARWSLRGIRSESCPAVSDITWKQNIEPLSSSLEKVMLLQGVSYDWKVDEYPEKGFTNTRQIGFIAQDVEKVFPELVRTDTNGYKSIYYAQMVAVLLEAMKEQQKEISDLRKQQEMIAALTEKISQLEKALEQKGTNLSASVK